MSDFINDPTGLREDRNGPRKGRTVLILLGLAIMMLLGWAAISSHTSSGSKDEVAASEPKAAPSRTSEPSSVAVTQPEADQRTPEQKAEEEAEEARIALEPQVRADMCEDYGERYIAARTGVELVRTVQLSQAAGCGWESMLHADAATHRFLPEALAVAKRMEAEEVPTMASTSTGDAELLEDMNRRIERIESSTDDIRRRVR